MSRAFVLGNCQADGLSDWMRAAAPDLTVEHASIAGVAPGDPAMAAAWSTAIERSDIVFCQLTDEQMMMFGLPAVEAIVGANKVFVRLPVVAFKGFQPDCTDVFTGGAPIVGAMGPYHSAIAAAAFLEGLDLERALGLYNTFAYAALGYFAEFEAASIVLQENAGRMGLDLSDGLRPGAPVFMHTINHPGIGMLGHVALQGLRRAGVEHSSAPPTPHDYLGDSFRWPVYPQIAARLGVEGGLSFQVTNAGGQTLIDLRALTEATYAAMGNAVAVTGPIVLDQDRPMATPVIERAQAFMRRHVVF